MAKIILDPGHGGNDLGDVYGTRFEKNDNLRLALAIGRVLEDLGYTVEYTRITDMYLSQFDRVEIANSLGGDFLLSLNRVVGELPISTAGLGFYLAERGGLEELAAENIGAELFPLGYCNYSIEVRSELPILSRTDMPSLMMAIGYLNSEEDNIFFDTRLDEIATAIAMGIYDTIPVDNLNNLNISENMTDGNNAVNTVLYGVRIGLFADYNNALFLYNDLLKRGYPVRIIYYEPYYAVVVGAHEDLDTVAELEFRLRMDGYDTIVIEM